MSRSNRYDSVEVIFVPRSKMEIAYKRTACFVRAFDGVQFSLHDLASWAYGQGVMDGIQVAHQRPELLRDEPTLHYEI
jgi:hypothetical protein